MIWKIAKKEFLLNLMTFKFAVGTILCVVLMAVFMPVLAKDYQQRLKDYNANVAANEAEFRKVKVYRNITPTIYRPPAVLSVFSGGLEKQLGNSAKIDLSSVPEINATSAEVNPYLSIFSVLDGSLVLRIVVSVLALLVAYDVISGEREQGTLKLMLSDTVARYQVLLGKILAGLMTLIVPTTAAFIIGLVILLSFPMVDLTGFDWIRIGLMYLASVIFISVMYNIGLFFSCLARSSAISLVLGLFFWIVFAIIVPNGSIYLAAQICPLESEEKMDSQLGLISEKLSNDLKRIRERLPDYESVGESGGDGAFGNFYVRLCDKALIENRKKRYPLQEPIRIKYADKLWQVKQSYLNNLFRQKYLADNLSRISPIFLHENVMSALAGTSLTNFQYFTDKVKTHRNKVIGYIRSKSDNFSLPSYFTICSEEEAAEYPKMVADLGSQNWHAWRDKKFAASPSLDLQDLPPFVCRSDIVKSLQRTIPDLALLIFFNAMFFALSFFAFVRYDVRSD